MPLANAVVKTAIRRYDNGERPYRFTRPRAWYLVGGQGRLYPLKYIYALATSQIPSSFTTSDAIRDLRQLGFALKRVPDFEAEFSRRVEKSLEDDQQGQARRARLDNAPKKSRKPRLRVREVVAYERNPDVVAEVLTRADGKCEACKKPAPFLRRSNGKPYLEVHHVMQLADGGDDTVENAIAVCPNCHRKAHYG
ncbi:HNH endonuclease [Acidithiobacillus ferrooxidans]|uniref:HNH endonuclease n=1 Tax=Acidithiobacillus ferrooxidans TaxID=920 RepID=UPI003D16DDA3